MAESKQSHLNGAYYGPSIPPRQSYHRPGRGPGCDCGPCCLISFVFKLIATLAILAGIVILIIWLVLRPSKIKFHVVDASLTEFNLTSDNTLQYNLALDMTVRNPNKRIGIYYDRIEARAYYDGKIFDKVSLTPFYQGHKNTSFLRPSFKGASPIQLGSSEISDFNTDKGKGIFDVEVKLYLRIRFKIKGFKTNRFKPRIECDLEIPLSSNSSSSGSFDTKRCGIDFWRSF